LGFHLPLYRMEVTHPIYYGTKSADELLNMLFPGGSAPKSVFFLHDAGVPEADFRKWAGHAAKDGQVMKISGGESAKTVEVIQSVWQFLLDRNADRHSLLIHLGGGALCDAGGFAASCFKRGIDFVHVPTTLLSMVDASVGGKTGINFGEIKNSIGTFAMPKAVVIRPEFLNSLPSRELLSGYAEMIKHGLIADPDHLEQVEKEFKNKAIPSAELIRNSIEIKRKIVESDPLEKGARALLNFGHTVGHAIESISEGKFLHGEAVASGLWVEMKISERAAGLAPQVTDHFASWAFPLWERVNWMEINPVRLFGKMNHDKKNRDGQIGMTLLSKPGHAIWGNTIEKEWIKKAWMQILEETKLK
jgi:3-dehydroquinate synthase